MSTVEVLFTPAEFETLERRGLEETTCVVFDVLRATSTMIAALAHGADSILPVKGVPEALEAKALHPDVLLAGEREGRRIASSLTGGVDFDLGNSPREFSTEAVQGRRIVMTTTNGTRALRACAHARTLLIGSFFNLGATVDFLSDQRPGHLLLICGGTGNSASYEDALGAGALCQLLREILTSEEFADSALMACKLHLFEQSDLPGAFAKSQNGRRLLSIPELNRDVAYCARRDVFPVAAGMDHDGWIRKIDRLS